VIAVFFTAIVLILLVSNEFSWRTARQNVIDGLSKEEFFVAKLLLLPVVSLLFFAILVGVGGGFGAAGTQSAGAAGPLLRTVDARALGGALVGLLGWVSFAFLLAVTIRSAGAAMGAFFLYFIVEQAVGGALARLGEGVAAVVRLLPMAVFKALWEPARYGVVPLEKGETLPVATSLLVVVGAAYALTFVAIAFLLYRRRDL
jgi:hypothetical protein